METKALVFAFAKLFLKMLVLGIFLSGATYALLGWVGMQERMRILFSVIWLAMVFIVFLIATVSILTKALAARRKVSGPNIRKEQ